MNKPSQMYTFVTIALLDFLILFTVFENNQLMPQIFDRWNINYFQIWATVDDGKNKDGKDKGWQG